MDEEEKLKKMIEEYIIINEEELEKIEMDNGYIEELIKKLPEEIPIEYKTIMINVFNKGYKNTSIITNELYKIMKDMYENRSYFWEILIDFVEIINNPINNNCYRC